MALSFLLVCIASQTFQEGDVVGFHDGKVSLNTAHCRIYGVISARYTMRTLALPRAPLH